MDVARQYHERGFVFGVPIITAEEADNHRRTFEEAEVAVGEGLGGGGLHYFNKMHLFLRSPRELATSPAVLDVVRQCIGDDILLYNCTYIIKEPHSQKFASWHQDLTYWGLSDDRQVSMWLALTEATAENGCMRMIPGSHRGGEVAHTATDDANNVLDLGQTVAGVDEGAAIVCELAAGEASFHHGWVLHASDVNSTDGRRIGLNVQYISPGTRQVKAADDTAMLVAGEDSYGHYGTDEIVSDTLTPDSVADLIRYREKFKEMYRL